MRTFCAKSFIPDPPALVVQGFISGCVQGEEGPARVVPRGFGAFATGAKQGSWAIRVKHRHLIGSCAIVSLSRSVELHS
jgi:hypothetical protein